MLNYIFSSTGESVGIAVFAHDGFIWEETRLEEALHYHHTSNPHNNLKLYEDAIERIAYFKYLGIWFVKKLTLKMFLE